MIEKVLADELGRLARECRIHGRGKNARLSLLRTAAALESLLKSLNDVSINTNNPLTSRESEILSHVSRGYTNREIANALNLSEKTIEYHLRSIFTKIQASTRTEAVKIAFDNDWLG